MDAVDEVDGTEQAWRYVDAGMRRWPGGHGFVAWYLQADQSSFRRQGHEAVIPAPKDCSRSDPGRVLLLSLCS